MGNFALPLFDVILELSAAMEGKMGEDKAKGFFNQQKFRELMRRWGPLISLPLCLAISYGFSSWLSDFLYRNTDFFPDVFCSIGFCSASTGVLTLIGWILSIRLIRMRFHESDQ